MALDERSLSGQIVSLKKQKSKAKQGRNGQLQRSMTSLNIDEPVEFHDAIKKISQNQTLEQHLSDVDGLKYFKSFVPKTECEIIQIWEKLRAMELDDINKMLETLLTLLSDNSIYTDWFDKDMINDLKEQSTKKHTEDSLRNSDFIGDLQVNLLVILELFFFGKYKESSQFQEFIDKKIESPKNFDTSSLFLFFQKMEDVPVQKENFFKYLEGLPLKGSNTILDFYYKIDAFKKLKQSKDLEDESLKIKKEFLDVDGPLMGNIIAVEKAKKKIGDSKVAEDTFDELLWWSKKFLFDKWKDFYNQTRVEAASNYTIAEIKSIYGEMRDSKLGLAMKEIKKDNDTFLSCLPGREFINWLSVTRKCGEDQAKDILIRLLDANFLKCISLKEPLEPGTLKEDELYTWVLSGASMYKKIGLFWKRCWFEMEEVTEVVSIYSIENKTSEAGRLIGTINLEGSKIEQQDKKGKYFITITEKDGGDKIKKNSKLKGKKHRIYTDNKELRDYWVAELKRARDFSVSVESVIETAGEQCRLCIEGPDDEEEEIEELNEDFWTCEVLDYGEKPVKIKDVVESKTTVLVLLRHFGCCICRQSAGRILSKLPAFEELGLQIVALGTGTPKIAKLFAKEYKFPGLIFCDPKRRVYRALNCKFGAKFLANNKSLAAIKKANSEGFNQGYYAGGQGVHRQMGGVFCVHPKYGVVYQHIDQYLGNQPNLDTMLKKLTRFCEENPQDNWTSKTILRSWDEMWRVNGDDFSSKMFTFNDVNEKKQS